MKAESQAHHYPHVTNDTVYLYIVVEDVPSRQAINKEIRATIDGTSNLFDSWYRPGCNHTHDCCGCWMTWAMEVIHYNKIAHVAIVQISNSKNV